MTRTATDPAAAALFFQHLWPEPSGLLGVYSLPQKRSKFFEQSQPAITHAMKASGAQNVYLTAGAFTVAPDEGRGTEDLIGSLPALWADVDIKGPAHKADNLPSTVKEAMEIVMGAGVKPTLLVHSGHGLQAWWCFKEPWTFESSNERQQAKTLSVRWQQLLRLAAAKHGWTLDGTADLNRVLRIPGTINHKIAGDPKPVLIQVYGPRYAVSELSEMVEHLPAPSSAPAPHLAQPYNGLPSDLAPIIDGCAWMRHCQDDAATLPEPEWYRMLSVVARCNEPQHFAHRLSKPYPGYSASQTDAKLAQAGGEAGPVTCRYVETNFGDTRFCLSCSHQGRVKSPVQLGEPKPPAPEALWENHQPSEITESELIPDWREKLQCQQRRLANGEFVKGPPTPNTYNACLPLWHDPELRGAIAFNELRRQITITRPVSFEQNTPCPWEDRHDIALSVWCQKRKLNIGAKTAGEAVILVAQKNRFHPVRDYLSKLEWDQCPRISRWLPFYCGTEDSAYTQTVGRKWLISAVARAMQPGSKVDTCLILEGQQGILKSTALATLGGEWYTDEIEDLTSKDAAQQASRVWIIEMGELSALSRSEKNMVKAFLSRSVDQFRPAYGRHVQVLPRQCVFAGTTNQQEYFEDETGNRRFWPAACTRILIEELARDRDQLWAEAVEAFRGGESWWIEDEAVKVAAREATAERMREDPWLGKVAEWVDSRLGNGSESVSTEDVLSFCIEKPQKEWTRGDQMRVGAILRQCGLVRYRIRCGDTRSWEYSKPRLF